MLQNKWADRGKASRDAWFGCWLPVRAPRRSRQFRCLVVAALFAVSLASAVQRWDKVYGGASDDLGYDVHQTRDGGYIVAASERSFNANDKSSAWLLKLDSLGDTTWTRTFVVQNPGSSAALAVCQARDWGYAAGGVWRSSVGTDHDTICFYLMKLDEQGDSVWCARFGMEYDCNARDIEQTTDGGYILAGIWQSWANPPWRGFAVKCDSLGNEQWSHVYGDDTTDWFWSAHQTSDGGYIMAGCANTWSGKKAWMVRADSAGNVRWMRTYGGNLDQAFNTCIETPDGGFIGAGGNNERNEWGDCWMVKVDGNGDTLFTRYLYEGPDGDCVNSVCRTLDGGYMFGGATNSIGAGRSDGLLIKTDSGCNVEWIATVGSALSDDPNSVDQTADSGYVLAGNTYDGYSEDIHVWKTDPAGAVGIRQYQTYREERRSLELAGGQFAAAGSVTSVRYFVPEPGRVELALYDITGRKRLALAAGRQAAGWHEAVLDCRVPAGAYVLRLTEGAWSAAQGVKVLR